MSVSVLQKCFSQRDAKLLLRARRSVKSPFGSFAEEALIHRSCHNYPNSIYYHNNSKLFNQDVDKTPF